MLDTHDRIFVAGHRGMVGSALVRRLEKDGFKKILTRSRQNLDLTEQRAVRRFFSTAKVDTVILAAARVGGVHANNTFRADFIYENLMIEANVIHQAFVAGVRRLLFLEVDIHVWGCDAICVKYFLAMARLIDPPLNPCRF